ALFFALVLYGPFANSKQIAFSDFLRLASEGELKKVVFVGKDRAMGVAKESEKEWIKKLELPKGQFNVSLPPAQDRMPLAEEIRAKNPDVQIDSEEEYGAWVGPALSALLMTMLLLGVLFLFVLPRFKDPLGGTFLSNYVKSPARRYERSKGRVTFEDV